MGMANGEDLTHPIDIAKELVARVVSDHDTIQAMLELRKIEYKAGADRSGAPWIEVPGKHADVLFEFNDGGELENIAAGI